MKTLRTFLYLVIILSLVSCNLTKQDTPADGGPASGESQALSEEEAYNPTIEDLSLQGKINPPAGVSWTPQELTVFSSVGESAVDANGAFQLPAMRAPNNTLLIAATNPQGNAVLLALLYPGQEAQPLELSLDSTAKALVLFDTIFLALPQDQQAWALELTANRGSYETLLAALQQALQQDAAAPLDGDSHPELYQLAAQVVMDVGTLMGLGQTEMSSTSLRLRAALVPALQQQRSNEYVWVEDDIDHNLPTVKLMNASWSYYKATIYASEQAGANREVWDNTLDRPIVLERVKPYTLNLTSTSGVKQVTEKEISPGDKYLQFTFAKDYDTTLVDIIGSSIQLILGVSPGNPEALVLKSIVSEAADLVQNTVIFVKTLKGKTYQEAGTEFGLYLNKVWISNLRNLIQIQVSLLKREAKDQYIGLLGKIVSSKALWVAEAVYMTVDTAPMVYSLANAPDVIEEGGLQKDGRYPALVVEVLPNPIILQPASGGTAGSAISQPAGFNVWARELSPDIGTVRFQVNYGDDTDPEELYVYTDDRQATGHFEHAFARVPDFVRILVFDDTKDRVLLGETLVPVEMAGKAMEGKKYTLLFKFDSGCDGVFMGSYTGYNRVSPIPLVIDGKKATIAYDKTTGDKHLVASGSGVYDPASGALQINNIEVQYSIIYTDYEGNRVTGTETFFGTLTATVTDDQALEYEYFEGLATGTSSVAYPNSNYPEEESNEKYCSAGAIGVSINEGFVDADL